ncbi:MAG: PqqD family protein [Nitrospirales bacterium]|nr:PqqD family protein [Nitrospirales bacterium]
MGEFMPSPKKELFIGSHLRPKVGREEKLEGREVGTDATNQEIHDEALQVLGGIGSVSTLDPAEWQNLKDWRLQPHEDVHSTVLEGETVLLNLDNGMYYSLNRVGTVIWELCDGRRTLQQILGEICERFEVEEGQAKQDLLVLSSQLLEQKLLTQAMQ